MPACCATMDTLPNELLFEILALIPTKALLPLAVLSSRFHALVLRLFELRLASAASLQGCELVIETRQPSLRLSDPVFCCTYLSTPALNDDELSDGVEGSVTQQTDTATKVPGQRFKELRDAYTHFLPHKRSECAQRLRFRSRPHHLGPHATANSNDSGPHARNGYSAPGATTASSSLRTDGREASAAQRQTQGGAEQHRTIPGRGNRIPPNALPEQYVHLGQHESFSQLTAVATLMSRRPESGRVRSTMTLSDGVLRLWKDWLSEACRKIEPGADTVGHERVAWVNDGPQNLGMKLRVHICPLTYLDRRAAERGNGNSLVMYRVEFEEILVRTTSLLQHTEKMLEDGALTEIGVSVLGMQKGGLVMRQW